MDTKRRSVNDSSPVNSGTTGTGTNPPSNSASGFTANAFLFKPATAQRNWDAALNANADILDGMSAIGQLLVTTTEVPSASLNVRVTSGSYVKGDGTVGSYSGVATYALPPSTTTSVWLTDTAVLTTSATFPTTAHLPLAQVVTSRIHGSIHR